ncbi:MAG: hypothetical protein LBS96_04170 [Oscillospiraceae bacterium]|jgi:uncharacterized phage-associated protein|nr:hypothetical protein [Oscillospiraceae bacterium]
MLGEVALFNKKRNQGKKNLTEVTEEETSQTVAPAVVDLKTVPELNVFDVAKFCIDRFRARGGLLDANDLMKALYWIFVVYLVEEGRRCFFTLGFSAASCGPIIKEINESYIPLYGLAPIELALDGFKEVDEKTDQKLTTITNRVLAMCSEKSALYISRTTHWGDPWIEGYNRKGNEIPLEELYNFYASPDGINQLKYLGLLETGKSDSGVAA